MCCHKRYENNVLIAFGANTNGNWGCPRESLSRAIKILKQEGFSQIKLSPLYCSKPIGSVRQPHYLNLVGTARCAEVPRQVIDLFKRIERCSGRRPLGRNASRPLDIDLLDYRGWRINARNAPPAMRPKLVLPHPRIAERPFVVVPLVDVAPGWRHPVTGLTPVEMLHRLGGRRRLELRREIWRVDSPLLTCD